MIAHVCAHRWEAIRGACHGPQPVHATLASMLDELAEHCRANGRRPVGVQCQAWRRPVWIEPDGGNDFAVRIAIATESGVLNRSMRSWFAWQHPVWAWSKSHFPRSVFEESRALG
jgi:hypothetical protein